jgi:integrase
MTSMKLDLPYLMADTDRHGNRRLFVRRNGRKIRLRESIGTTAFLEAYRAALAALEELASQPQPQRAVAPADSLGWLAASYFGSPEFRALDRESQSTRRLVIEDCLREPRKPGSADLMRACPLAMLSTAHLLMLRDRKAHKPGAANNRLKYLSAMFGWAVERGIMRSNPARDAKPIRYSSSGFHTWTLAEVEQFQKSHPIGTKAHLALGLLLFLGVRRGDAVMLGKQHVRDGWISFVPRKTRYKRARMSQKPILPELARIIAASPCGNLTFLVTDYGRPFTPAGFGGWFRKRCDEAGLPHCSAHGLRKIGATIAAEAGATDRQLMALFDWETASQATVYTAAASRKKLAGEAARLLSREPNGNTDCPTELPHQKLS